MVCRCLHGAIQGMIEGNKSQAQAEGDMFLLDTLNLRSL